MSIVNVFNEDADRLAGVFKITIVSAVNLLLLECLHKALCFGVVVGIAHATHAWLDLMRCKHRGIIMACILDTAIGVMDQTAGRRSACFDRHLECGQSEFRPQKLLQGPTDHSSAECIEHHSQERELFQQSDVSNICHLEPIKAG